MRTEGSSGTLGSFPMITLLVNCIACRRPHHLAFLLVLFSTSHPTTQEDPAQWDGKRCSTSPIQPYPRLPISTKSFESASGLPLLRFHSGPVLTPITSCPPQPLREKPSLPPQSPNPLQDSGAIATQSLTISATASAASASTGSAGDDALP